MENNVQVQKTADISSLVCVVIVSLSALTAYNLGEKFNHYILFDVTIFIISLVMLIFTFAVFRKVMAGLYKSISNSTINEQVQSNCSQKVISDNSITETQPVILEQMPDSLEKYESILVEEQLKEVKRKRDTMIAIREYVVEKASKYLSKENISTLGEEVKEGRPKGSGTAEQTVREWQESHPAGKKADWILNGGIEKEWDSYLKKMEQYGLSDYLSIKQKYFDEYQKSLSEEK